MFILNLLDDDGKFCVPKMVVVSPKCAANTEGEVGQSSTLGPQSERLQKTRFSPQIFQRREASNPAQWILGFLCQTMVCSVVFVVFYCFIGCSINQHSVFGVATL